MTPILQIWRALIKSDSGMFSIEVTASSKTQAKKVILGILKCPERAIQGLKRI